MSVYLFVFSAFVGGAEQGCLSLFQVHFSNLLQPLVFMAGAFLNPKILVGHCWVPCIPPLGRQLFDVFQSGGMLKGSQNYFLVPVASLKIPTLKVMLRMSLSRIKF